jgi:hypothetical protein
MSDSDGDWGQSMLSFEDTLDALFEYNNFA